MQLQTEVLHRDWSSAAATSIPPTPTASSNEKNKRTRRRIRQTFAANKTLIKRYEAVLLINNTGD